MRRALVIGLVIAAAVAVVLLAGASNDGGSGDYKVRAIFDNASFAIKGQDVKVAGAKVGTIEDLDVTADKKAALVLKIDKNGFKDFRKDASCEIRLQSVIGEKLVECSPTQPREPGAPLPPPLDKIPDDLPGAGQYLLPASNTTTPVDADLINNINRLPFRQRLSVLLNEFGTGLAARAEDLRELLREGDPALREFDQFLNVLANQNKMLKQLTGDADKIFRSFAKNRREVADFFVQSGIAAEATAEKRADLERNFAKFPPFLRQLRPFMDRFATLSQAMEPVISDLRASGPDISRILKALGPFSTNSTAALKSLGNSADVGRPALVGAQPVAEQLASLVSRARPVIKNLRLLLVSLQKDDGINNFVDLLFNQTLSFNGFDEVGHYLRNNLIVTICSGYSLTPTVGCSANFQGAGASAASSSTAPVQATSRRLAKILGLESGKSSQGNADKAKAGADKNSTPVKSGGKDTNGGDAKPKSESPSRPAPQPAPAAGKGTTGDDGLVDYLLGGAGQ
jgi:phospholipid/cholesterol/gamma-HCH transport system substrate-binding protein